MALIKEDMDDFGISMLPPNINKSFPRFRPESDEKSRDEYAIRFGFNAIKQMSGDLKEFTEERKRVHLKIYEILQSVLHHSLTKAKSKNS